MVGISGASINVIDSASAVTFGTLAASRHAASHPAVPPPTITTRSIAMVADTRTLMGLHSLRLPECRLRGWGTLASESGESTLALSEAHAHAGHLSGVAGRHEGHVVDVTRVPAPARPGEVDALDEHRV